MKADYLWFHLQQLPYFRALLRAVEARLLQDIALPAPVLDVGSGDGHFASIAFPARIDLGIDPAWKSTLEARGYGAYRALVIADGAALPIAADSFGSAVSNSVLEHVANLDQVLAEVCRVLRPGAPMAITVPNPGYRSRLAVPAILRRIGWQRAARAYEDWFMRVTRTINLLDEQTWRERFADAGLQLESYQRYFSPGALRALEWGHYFGLPSLVSRVLFGRWILSPSRANLWLTARLLRKYYSEKPADDGTYTLYLVSKPLG